MKRKPGWLKNWKSAPAGLVSQGLNAPTPEPEPPNLLRIALEARRATRDLLRKAARRPAAPPAADTPLRFNPLTGKTG